MNQALPGLRTFSPFLKRCNRFKVRGCAYEPGEHHNLLCAVAKVPLIYSL